ncbi:hypothetical protein HPB52_009702 [Rhipicephalus sanguineus]|uniref:Uncharacterized protein n=1 Tax=Rhipicephalus sanguineus TaxID=34632 RepID=A0A9D4T9B2_RHISA|nr:hypothetical protein HPB52_009702 [Rhipicephalus sanguineus]
MLAFCEDRRKDWERNLKRKDKPLAETSAVREKHFAAHFVIRDYVHVIRGNEVRIPRAGVLLQQKVRLSRRDEQEASLVEDQNFEPNARAFENDEVNSLVPGDLQALAHSPYVPRLWTKLITPNLDVLVFATTRTRKEPFEAGMEEMDSKLLHMWEAKRSLQERWKRQKHNRRLRRESSRSKET